MRKRTRRKPVTGLNLFERAEIRRAWQVANVKASIHALIGDDVQALVRQAGAIIYGVVSACEDDGIDGGDTDLCAVHSAANALVALPAEAEIDGVGRNLIADGLAACARLQPRLNPVSMRRAADEIVKARIELEGRAEARLTSASDQLNATAILAADIVDVGDSQGHT